jgi:hypothetical protein
MEDARSSRSRVSQASRRSKFEGMSNAEIDDALNRAMEQNEIGQKDLKVMISTAA